MKNHSIIVFSSIFLLLLSGFFPVFAGYDRDAVVFGSIVGWGQEDLMKEAGIRNIGMVGTWLFGWDIVMPDGKNIDKNTILKVDKHIKAAAKNGSSILFRLRTGGNGPTSFSAIPDKTEFPVDFTDYPDEGPTGGYKNGEYLGTYDVPYPASNGTNFPPKILTDDSPGNTSPWYDFVYAIASRYNGRTPDPAEPGKLLPEVEYFSTSGEMDTKHYWYGTATDLYGRPDENGTMIGLLPTIHRALKAANPNAKIVAGGFLAPHTGFRILYEMIQEGATNDELKEFNDRYFKYQLFFTISSGEYIRTFLENIKQKRARKFFNHCMETNQFWNIFAFHSYFDYTMHDTIGHIKKKMSEHGIDRPIWGKEMGFPCSTPQPETQIANRLFKKFVSTFGAGAQLCAVTPFVTFINPTSLYFPGPGLYSSNVLMYRTLYPNAAIEQIMRDNGSLMLETFLLLTKHISDCKVVGYELNGEAAIYVFGNSEKDKTVIMGWTDKDEDQLYLKDFIDLKGDENFVLYSYLGKVQPPVIPEILTNEPFMMVLNGDSASYFTPDEPSASFAGAAARGYDDGGDGGGCSIVNPVDTAFKKNGLFNVLIWLSPALYIFWRRRLAARPLP